MRQRESRKFSRMSWGSLDDAEEVFQAKNGRSKGGRS
jgi:hypothetical protein